MSWLHFLLYLLIFPSLFVTDGSYFPCLLFLASSVFPEEVCLHTPQAGRKHGNELRQTLSQPLGLKHHHRRHVCVLPSIWGKMDGATRSWLCVAAECGENRALLL